MVGKNPSEGKSAKRVRNALLFGFAPLGIAGVSLYVAASRFEPVIRPNVTVGKIDVGGLTKDEARKKLRVWWEMEKTTPLSLTHPLLKQQPKPESAASLGIRVDDEATLAQVSLEDFWEALGRKVSFSEAPAKSYAILFSWDEKKAERLSKFVADQVGSPQKASVKWTGSQFIRQREQVGFTLDREKLRDVVLQALENGGSGELPIVEAPKSVPDAALESINEVRTSFTTKFSTAKVTRCANIKLAASKIDGYVLMPGERFSFNQTVGRRTQSGGFKVAGVYRNGRHDFDIGGGICQVSTTLYNAALLSNLKIVARGNHSMPVPYVPLGRDATVDYGAQDLVFENSLDHPIALSTHYGPGRITFHILGKKDPGLEVKIVTSGHRSWDKGVKYEHDPNLAYGVTKVTEKGSAGHSVNVARLVYRDGKLVSRESLGQSYYRGGVKIIAKNMKASAPAEGAVASPPAPAEPPAPINQ